MTTLLRILICIILIFGFGRGIVERSVLFLCVRELFSIIFEKNANNKLIVAIFVLVRI